MSNPSIQTRNFVLTSTSSFRIDFDITSGEDRIQSIAGGGAIDGYDYLMIYDSTGQTREFTFDFSGLKKTISTTSIVNVVIRITDIDDHVFEWAFSKNYATENGLPSIANARISQRSDGSRLVDVEYDYNSPNEIDPATVTIQLSSDWGKNWDVPATSMTGDVGTKVAVGPNRKATWDLSADLTVAVALPLSARISIINADGVTAVGETHTGTIILYPSDSTKPMILLMAEDTTQVRHARKTGNLHKHQSINFVALP